MANNYLQFSVEILLTDTEAAWFRTFLDDSEELEQIAAEDGGEIGFDHTWITNYFGDKTTGILFYAEENGEYGNLLQVLAAFLVAGTTRYKQLGFTYSETCSSMGAGEFGGGACIVKKLDDGTTVEEHVNAYEWLIDKMGREAAQEAAT